ncbi:IS66 family insertion sequence element accessory protein TnpB [Bradyrhizobium ottawaense]|uniref:IS66 family insertion sequence element accessory protein TnpB n=1 Tax=Bradyrhizobium ottawaense TaxID=931866 RepID=UPI003FA100AE
MTTRPADFRCGHHGLAAKVQEMLGLDPFSGAASCFGRNGRSRQDSGLGSNGPGAGAQAP